MYSGLQLSRGLLFDSCGKNNIEAMHYSLMGETKHNCNAIFSNWIQRVIVIFRLIFRMPTFKLYIHTYMHACRYVCMCTCASDNSFHGWQVASFTCHWHLSSARRIIIKTIAKHSQTTRTTDTATLKQTVKRYGRFLFTVI